MSRTDKRGRNRGLSTVRVGTHLERRRRTTEAESYLTLGKIIRQWLRRGGRCETLARGLEVPLHDSLIALRFADSSPALILRALVEEWPWDKIKQSLCEPQKSELTSRRQL